MKYFVTGAAGFVGFHISLALLKNGHRVYSIDNLNDYYDPQLKRDRLAILQKYETFEFQQGDVSSQITVNEIFSKFQPERVIHMAAQAGVRHSLQNPHAYVDSNIHGFLSILESCRNFPVEHLIFASTSSVYGLNSDMPFSVHSSANHPISLYSATKKANEAMAHSYSHLFSIPITGLRFFTVYGPWGRPDMALFLFTKAILEGKPIDLFNNGDMLRDFTYVDDIIETILRLCPKPPQRNPIWDSKEHDPSTSSAPYRILNIGNNHPVNLNDFIAAIESSIGKKAVRNPMPMQAGDVFCTFADMEETSRITEFSPQTSITQGVEKFVSWYRSYYKI